MPRKQFDVFLSYSRADSARVLLLRDELVRMGYRVFYDVDSIRVGTNWKHRIDTAVEQSRVLVLSWSGHALPSEFIAYEYQRAHALHRPLYPWLLDGTHLPAMIAETNGITLADPIAVAARLKSSLGATLPQRRMRISLIAATLLIVCAAAGAWQYHETHLPWHLTGRITDYDHNPLSHVSIDVRSDSDGQALGGAETRADGTFDLPLPLPQPDKVHITIHAPGFTGDEYDIDTHAEFRDQLHPN